MNKIRNSKFEIRNYRKILIVRLDRIGDVILSTPVIKALRDAYPDSRIAFMASPHAREILEGNPYLDEVIIYDKLGKQKGLIGNLKFIAKLRRKKFDIAIALHPTARTHQVISMAGIPERIGYDKKLGFLLTKRMPHTKQFGLKHEIEYALDMLRYIGVEPKERALYMPLSPECAERVRSMLDKYGVKDADKIAVINPSASCPSKRWSAERFAKVADELIEKRGMKVIMISSKADAIYAGRTASFMNKPCINLLGKTSIGDLAGILSRARILISNDSGPVHIACAVGTPAVVIFGRKDRGLSPKRWGPVGKDDVVIHKDAGCEVCRAHNCAMGFKCLAAVTADDVLGAVDKILNK
ncbi:MAG: lipopolysaccharide heptosyltransferase II [Candidatus Omnitrophota bacterium]